MLNQAASGKVALCSLCRPIPMQVFPSAAVLRIHFAKHHFRARARGRLRTRLDLRCMKRLSARNRAEVNARGSTYQCTRKFPANDQLHTWTWRVRQP
jgi:hypothetical protein